MMIKCVFLCVHVLFSDGDPNAGNDRFSVFFFSLPLFLEQYGNKSKPKRKWMEKRNETTDFGYEEICFIFGWCVMHACVLHIPDKMTNVICQILVISPGCVRFSARADRLDVRFLFGLDEQLFFQLEHVKKNTTNKQTEFPFHFCQYQNTTGKSLSSSVRNERR